MSEQPCTRNELSGHVGGNVVQAGAIHGDVVFGGSPTSPEVQEAQRHWARRQQRIAAAEAAQAAVGHRRAQQYVTFMRWRRRASVLFLLLAGAVVGWEQIHGWMLSGLQQLGALAALLAGAASVIGWVRATWVIRRWNATKTIKVPHSRLYW
ncbi:hypothetical protein GCM10023100_30200 [Actinocorallia cavernae]|uniref:Uncharacterized protein n=2 Tax=Actinomycetes TaxID=1760 RepID=A0ABP8SNL0_9ACTN